MILWLQYIRQPSYAVVDLRKLSSTASFGRKIPLFIHLFRPNEHRHLTMKRLLSLLEPVFAEEGSNKRKFQNEIYAYFVKYIREVASGRRENMCLEKICSFITGIDNEPVLGFERKPHIDFVEAVNGFIPTASTCVNELRLPTPCLIHPLSKDVVVNLFNLYDFAFCNTYFGLI